MPLLDDLRQRRTAAREAADQILTRAAEEQRDLAADELATYQGHVVEQREADDAIEQEHERLLAEARAASRAGCGPTLSRQALDTARAFRSAIYAKNPAPIEVYSDLPDESDPTLSTVTLKAFKYANYFEISQELANDTPTNLLDFLARQAALSLGLGATGYGNDLINGVGTTAPRGAAAGRRHRRHRPRRHRHDPDADIRVLLQRTDDEKASNERMHLDLETDDVEAEVQTSGGTRRDPL